MSRLAISLALAVAAILQPPPALAEEVRVANRTDLIQALRNAKPGVTILIPPGTYEGGLSQSGLQGTRDQPITIAAADPANPPVISGGTAGLHLSAPQHVELRDLIIQGARGNGLNIDDAGAGKPAGHDIVLRNVTVRSGQNAGQTREDTPSGPARPMASTLAQGPPAAGALLARNMSPPQNHPACEPPLLRSADLQSK